MSLPFRRVSNIDRSMIRAQFGGFKEKKMSAGNKENFATGSLQFGRELAPRKMLQAEGMEVRFAEPYSPEADEFRPVPLPTEIDFLDVCTGPPWSIGDDIEISRRKEMDHPQQISHREALPSSEVPTDVSI